MLAESFGVRVVFTMTALDLKAHISIASDVSLHVFVLWKSLDFVGQQYAQKCGGPMKMHDRKIIQQFKTTAVT
ncbi:MAG: hypothetical protein HZB53_07835 [Chloroflexi bacterium]|nr:hypothetical protein [Chloroflexota bacterium]